MSRVRVVYLTISRDGQSVSKSNSLPRGFSQPGLTIHVLNQDSKEHTLGVQFDGGGIYSLDISIDKPPLMPPPRSERLAPEKRPSTVRTSRSTTAGSGRKRVTPKPRR